MPCRSRPHKLSINQIARNIFCDTGFSSLFFSSSFLAFSNSSIRRSPINASPLSLLCRYLSIVFNYALASKPPCTSIPAAPEFISCRASCLMAFDYSCNIHFNLLHCSPETGEIYPVFLRLIGDIRLPNKLHSYSSNLTHLI